MGKRAPQLILGVTTPAPPVLEVRTRRQARELVGMDLADYLPPDPPPRRIQLRRSKGWRKPQGAVVVSRPSKWGNPFRPGGYVDPIDAYRGWLTGQISMGRLDPKELRGKDLACWCRLPPPGEPDMCHAAVLLEVANA